MLYSNRFIMKKEKVQSMDESAKKIWKQRLGLYAGVIAMLLVCWVFIWAYRSLTIRRFGADLHPKRQVSSVETVFYSMQDEAYAHDAMGDTGYTIGQQGSLLCCLAMAAEAKGVPLTPKDLNRSELYEKNAYQLDAIHTLPGLENARFEAYTSFAEDKVREILLKGEPCLARVLREGNVHWLCIVGTNEEDFLVLDPAGDGGIQPLKEPVFALGRLRFS